MNYQTLRDILTPRSGLVTVTRESLDAGIAALLDRYYQRQPLVIAGAELTADDGTSVTISGRASFLQMADLPLTARFFIDSSGQVQALLRYQLRDNLPGPAAWQFSRSFPQLPAVLHHSAGFPSEDFSGQQKPFVDSLALFDTYYVVTTIAGAAPDFGVPLVPGINFVSQLRAQGAVGVLEQSLSSAEPMVVYGPINLPDPTAATLPLAPFARAWDRPEVPGIHLQAALALDFKIGKLTFDRAAFRAYSPPSSEWLGANSSFRPLHGYSGRLAIPSAGIELELSAELQWGLPKALLFARCHGVTLGKLTQLVDLVGSDDLVAALPSELQGAVNQLEQLELMALGVDVELVGRTPQIVGLSFTVGLPKLTWKVWEDKLVVERIACRFDITAPFAAAKSARKLEVTLLGTLKIEGVPFSIVASSGRNFSVYASLESGHTIPLGALLKSYAPGVPTPSELTIKSMAVMVAPGRSYAMNMSLAGQPTPWTIPIGRRRVTLNGLSFAFSYPKGGPLTGSFAGSASLGNEMALAMNWTIGRSVVLRGTFGHVTLKGLIADLCDQAGDLPPAFDLAIESASVLVAQKGDTYSFQTASEIAGLGTFAFEVRSGSTGSGFAGGVLLTTGGTPSTVPGLQALAALERAFHLKKFLLVFSSLADPSFTFPDMAQFNTPQLATKQLALPTGTSGVIAGLNIFGEWELDTSDRQQSLLKTLLGLGGTEQITIQIARNPAEGSRLLATRRGKLQGHNFFYTFGVQLSAGKPSLFLTGSLTVEIQKQPRTFDLTMMFVTSGAFLSANMKSQTAIDCGAFKLSNLGLEIGVNWGGIPSFGIAATIDFQDFTSSVAVFFDSAEPTRSLVAGSISNFTARDILRAFVGGVQTPLDELLKTIAIHGTHAFTIPGDLGDALDGLAFDKVAAAFAAAKVTIPAALQQLTLVPKTRGATWHLTDLTKMRHYELVKKGDKIQVEVAPQFYFAPQATSIGTMMFPQAFYLSAAFSFAGFDTSATIDISPNKGIAIEAQLDKMVIIDERIFALCALQGSGGPKLSVATFAQPDNPVAEFRQPHFYVNGSLTLLGVKQGLFASVSVRGIEFELVGTLAPGVHFDLDARFGKSGFGASGQVKVGVGTIDLGKLGKAKINTQLEVALDLDIDGAAQDVR